MAIVHSPRWTTVADSSRTLEQIARVIFDFPSWQLFSARGEFAVVAGHFEVAVAFDRFAVR